MSVTSKGPPALLVGPQLVPRQTERQPVLGPPTGLSPWDILPGDEQQLYSKLLPGNRATHFICKGVPHHPVEKTHFTHFYPGSHPLILSNDPNVSSPSVIVTCQHVILSYNNLKAVTKTILHICNIVCNTAFKLLSVPSVLNSRKGCAVSVNLFIKIKINK